MTFDIREWFFPIKFCFCVVCIILLCVGLWFGMMAIFGDVIIKMDNTCKQYDMKYIHREGDYCLDNDGVLYPVYMECPTLNNGELCEITFLKVGEEK